MAIPYGQEKYWPFNAKITQNDLEKQFSTIVAPAGFGKTTLAKSMMRAWSAQGGISVFVSVDDELDDRVLIDEIFAEAVMRAFGAPSNGHSNKAVSINPRKPVVKSLASQLASQERQPLVIFDRLERLSKKIQGPFFDDLLRSVSCKTRVVALSRLPIAASDWQLDNPGAVQALGPADLKLDVDDIANILGLQPSDKAATRLHEISEGWPAAVAFLAGASRINGREKQEPMLSSRERALMYEYLESRVFCDFSDAEREFLNQTCLLDECDLHICDALRGKNDSLALFNGLERFFPLVSRARHAPPTWRYNKTLAEIAYQHRLTSECERTREDHRKVATIYEAVGDVRRALVHCKKSDSQEEAARLFIRCGGWRLGLLYGSAFLEQALQTFTDAEIRRTPSLAIAYSLLRFAKGGAVAALRDFLQAPSRQSDSQPDDFEQSCLLAILNTTIERPAANAEFQTLLQQLASEKPEDTALVVALRCAAAASSLLRGELREALQYHDANELDASLVGGPVLWPINLCGHIFTSIQAGKLLDASRGIEALHREMASQGQSEEAIVANRRALNCILRFYNDGTYGDHQEVASAISALDNNFQWPGLTDELHYIGIQMSIDGATRNGWQLTENLLSQSIAFSSNSKRLLALSWQLELAARTETAEAAETICRDYELYEVYDNQALPWRVRYELGIALAYWEIKRRHWLKAYRLLAELKERARNHRHGLHLGKINILLACVARARGLRQVQETCAKEALTFVATQDASRLLSAAPAEFSALASDLLKGDLSGLIKQPNALSWHPANSVETPTLPGLDTLSASEFGVARLLARGLRNKEIAWQLKLSENTVKFHLKNIFKKTGVNSRKELIAGLSNTRLSRI